MEQYNTLKIKHLSKRFSKIRSVAMEMNVNTGWIRFMSEALGISPKLLASRTGHSVPNLAQVQKREETDKIMLSTLRKIASAMDCELVYAIIPRKELGKFLKEKAVEKASRILLRADLHMELENQKVDTKMKSRIEGLAKELLEKGDIW